MNSKMVELSSNIYGIVKNEVLAPRRCWGKVVVGEVQSVDNIF